MYEYAEHLITAGKAYVCSLSDAEAKAARGNVTTPGTNSPYRERSVEENLDLFRRMRKGEFKDGEHVLRAKIDMANRQHENARSHALSHPPYSPPHDRRQVVHLPDVRLRASNF